LFDRCRTEKIEPPAPGRVERVVRSALRTGEETLVGRTASRLGSETVARVNALVQVDDDDPHGPMPS
jgi:hypothetical protein